MKGPKQIVDIPIAGGVESKIYKALVQPGKMIEIQNARIEKGGTVSKRYGYGEYEPPYSVYYDAPSIIKNTKFSDPADLRRPVSVSVNAKDCPTAIGDAEVIASDSAVNADGYLAVCYCDVTNSVGYMTCYDSNDHVLWSAEAAGMVTTPRVAIGDDGFFYFVYLGNSGSNLVVYVLDTDGVEYYYNDAIDTGLTTAIGVEVVAAPTSWTPPSGHNGNGVIISYFDGTDVKFQQVTVDGLTNCFQYTYTATAYGRVPTHPMALVASDREVCAAWPYATGGCAVVFNQSGYRYATSFLGGRTLHAPAGFWDISGSYDYFVLYWAERLTLTGSTYYWQTVSSYIRSYRISGAYLAAVETTNTWVSQAIVSKFVEFDGEWFCWTYFGHTAASASTESTQQKYLLQKVMFNSTTLGLISNHYEIVASALENEAMPSVVWRSNTSAIQPCSVSDLGGGKIATPLIRSRVAAQIATSSGMTNRTQAADVRANILAPVRLAIVRDRTVFTGGTLWSIDGDRPYENGFRRYPECVATSSSTSGGGLSDGTYYLKFTFRHSPPGGGVVESAPSVTTTVVVAGGGATQKITATVSGYAHGKRPYKVIPYISTDNIVFYEAPNDSWSELSDLVNHANYDITHAPTDTRILYTVGGASVENSSSWCLCDITQQDNRLYGVTPDARLIYSKTLISGEEVVFSPDYLVKKLFNDGGGYFQIASMDGQLVVFGVSSIQIIAGSGGDLGTNSTLSDSRVVPSDVGIRDGSPVCVTGNGVWFQSSDGGVCLFTRSGEINKQIGYPVDEYISSDIVGINSVGDEVRFVTGSETLVYNEAFGSWYVQSVCGIASCIENGAHVIVESDGTVLAEGSSFDDNGTAYRLVIETPWLRLGALQAVQRVAFIHALEEYRTDHDLKVSVFLDYDESAASTHTQTIESMSAGDAAQCRWHCGKRCESIKIRIEDNIVDGSDPAAEAMRIVSLALEIAVKRGLVRLGQSDAHGEL